MELHFKPKFSRDYDKINNHSVKIFLAGILRQIEKAENISQIGGLVRLREYESKYKIRIRVDEKNDYRVGFEIRNNIVWAERILRRPKFYKYYIR